MRKKNKHSRIQQVDLYTNLVCNGAWRYYGMKKKETMRKPDGICKWFLKCEMVATGYMPHPVLGLVPICNRCREKVDRLSA